MAWISSTVPPRPSALLCNVRTFGTYLHTAGDGQIDYYFILGKDREEIVKQYKEL